MGIFNRTGNPNATVGIFLLLLMGVLVSPNVLPRFASNLFPEFVYSGVPCQWLRRADDRAAHQSLLGRSVQNPFELTVVADTLPNPNDASGVMTIQITVRNNSLGTVPFVYDPALVSIGDNGTSGLGLLFTPTNSFNGTAQRGGDPAAFPEASIRLLGPRQSCVHTVELPAGNVLIDPALNSGNASVAAYYRGASAGQITQARPGSTFIFADQGLWRGYVQSEAVRILPAAAAPAG